MNNSPPKKIKKLSIEIIKLFTSNEVILCLIIFACIFDKLNIFRYTLIAAVIHELGHIFAYMALLKKIPKVTLKIYGLSIPYLGISGDKEPYILAAGPTVNILAFTLFFAVSLENASYNTYFFALINLVVAFYNLLPVRFLDGGRLLESLLPYKMQQQLFLFFEIFNTFLVVIILVTVVFVYQSLFSRIYFLIILTVFVIKQYAKEK